MGSAYALVYNEPDFPRINGFFFSKIISKTKIFNYTELHSTEYRRHPVCQMDTFPRE